MLKITFFTSKNEIFYEWTIIEEIVGADGVFKNLYNEYHKN